MILIAKGSEKSQGKMEFQTHLVDFFFFDDADFGSSQSIWQDCETLTENSLVQITENHFQSTSTVIRFVSTLYTTDASGNVIL